MSPWMKWMRTTLLSSLIMYSMLSRLITLSPTLSNLLMVHLLPPKSRAETPEGYPGPITYVASSAQRRRGLTPLFTQVRGIGILGSSLAGSCIKPRNTPPRWPWAGPIPAQGGRYYLRLDAYAASWMVATLLVMAVLPVHVSIGAAYSPIYTPIDSASSSVSSSCFWCPSFPTSFFVPQ